MLDYGENGTRREGGVMKAIFGICVFIILFLVCVIFKSNAANWELAIAAASLIMAGYWWRELEE